MTTYKEAGVDIDRGDALVERLKPLARRTLRPEVLAGVGGFGGLFALPKGYTDPVLVSGTDGVGTKLKVAFALDRHDTVGLDLVAMSVNDVLTSGAEPLFFLDYFATSSLDVAQAEAVIGGVAKGCELAGCTLLGGETAELPGFYARGEYELAGFCVAIVERAAIINGSAISPGDVVVGVASSGLHSNGYSLVRKVLADRRLAFDATVEGFSLAPALLEPTRIYVKDTLALLRSGVQVKGMAHITGSGIPGNLPRCLPDGLTAVIHAGRWQKAPIFSLLQELGGITTAEMFSTFNMGLGLILVVAPADAAPVVAHFSSRGVPAWEVGVIEPGRAGAEAEALVRP